jgi:Major tropism determinant N-terminal domain
MSTKIQFRRDSAANWTASNPILSEGELGLETDTSNYKIGNGVNTWNTLIYYQLSPEVTAMLLNVQSSDLSPPAAGTMRFYAKSLAGRALPRVIGPSGLDTYLQPLLSRNKIGYWCPQGNSTTVPGVLGYTAPTTVGTTTARNIATNNALGRMRRIGYVSSATAGSLASTRVSVAQITVGDGAGMGGFMKTIRFATSDVATVAGARMFVGVSSNTGAPTSVEPSTLTNSIGVGHGAANTNLFLYYGGSTAQTPIDLGVNFPANTLSADAYELTLYAPPNIAATVYYEVTRINTGDVMKGTLSGTSGTQIPAATTLMTYLWAFRTNNTTALSVGLDIISDYIETDS